MVDEEKMRQVKEAIETQLQRLEQEAQIMRDMSLQLEQYVEAVKDGHEVPDELIDLMLELAESEEVDQFEELDDDAL